MTKQYNLVPANGRWCLAAGNVTVGLASHWPRVTDISGFPPTGSRPRRGRWVPAYAVLVEYGELYLLPATKWAEQVMDWVNFVPPWYLSSLPTAKLQGIILTDWLQNNHLLGLLVHGRPLYNFRWNWIREDQRFESVANNLVTDLHFWLSNLNFSFAAHADLFWCVTSICWFAVPEEFNNWKGTRWSAYLGQGPLTFPLLQSTSYLKSKLVAVLTIMPQKCYY